MTPRLLIVGGGLSGLLAGLDAPALGYADVRLLERLDVLGGIARSTDAHGSEIREGTLYFGPPGDSVTDALMRHGATFEIFENRYASVSIDASGARTLVSGFGGPAWAAGSVKLRRGEIRTLADRFAAYPPATTAALTAYCQWHLDADPADLHHDAATALAVNRVYPCDVPAEALVQLKRADPLYDELYGLPSSLWARAHNATAAVPTGGFNAMFERLQRRLDTLGVQVCTGALMTPAQALAAADEGQVVLWAANPLPLAKAVGLRTPPQIKKTFSIYTFEISSPLAAPFYIQNFTATGVVFRAYLYVSGGRTMLTAECVREPSDEAALQRELSALFEEIGPLAFHRRLAQSRRPRWIYHSAPVIEMLMELRRRLANRCGSNFIPGAWEAYGKSQKFIEIRGALVEALSGRLATALRA